MRMDLGSSFHKRGAQDLPIIRQEVPLTRSQHQPKMHVPYCRTSFGQRSLSFSLPKLYNEFLLHLNIHETHLTAFKKLIKDLLK